MKSITFSVIFSTICLTLFGQHSIQFTTDFSQNFREIVVVKDYGIETDAILETRARHEAPRIQYRLGVDYLYAITPQLQIKTGLRYAEVGYTATESSTDSTLIWASDHDGNGGVIGPPPSMVQIESIEIFKKHRYLTVPLLLRYTPSQTAFSPFIEAGVSSHIYINTNNISIVDGERSSSIYRSTQLVTYEPMQWVGVLGIGFSYTFGDNYYLSLAANGRYHLNLLAQNTNINERLYNYGGELSIGYKF